MKTKATSTNIILKWITTNTLVVTTCLISAQDAKTNDGKLYGGFGYLSVSGEQLNINQLNNSLVANGYGKFSTNATSFGGGGAFAIHNFIVGGGGAWLIGSGNQNGNNEVNIKGGYGFFHAGYIVYSGKRSLLYPTLGIGGGGYSINISKLNSPTDFNRQLNTPAGFLSTQAGGFMTSVAVSYQYFFSKSSLTGFYIGVKAGYNYSPGRWNVSVNNKNLSDAPKINMDGFFVTIFLGGGSVVKN